MVYLPRYKCSELSVINNTGLQQPISYIFPHSCCLQFFLHFTLQNCKESAHKEQKANCTDLKLLCFPTVMLFSKSVSFFCLGLYNHATPALPDGKTLSLNCHGLFGHEEEILALGGDSLDSRAEMQDTPQVVFRLRSIWKA